MNGSGFPVDYNTFYAVKAITLTWIVIIVVILDMKSLTMFTIVISIALFTIGPLFFVFLME